MYIAEKECNTTKKQSYFLKGQDSKNDFKYLNTYLKILYS